MGLLIWTIQYMICGLVSALVVHLLNPYMPPAGVWERPKIQDWNYEALSILRSHRTRNIAGWCCTLTICPIIGLMMGLAIPGGWHRMVPRRIYTKSIRDLLWLDNLIANFLLPTIHRFVVLIFLNERNLHIHFNLLWHSTEYGFINDRHIGVSEFSWCPDDQKLVIRCL